MTFYYRTTIAQFDGQ